MDHREQPTKPDIDVVITAFGRIDLTRSCLDHLSQQTRTHRVILVDNGSLDDTQSVVMQDYPHVHLIRIDNNAAFSVATNKGVAEGNSPFIVLMNNDVDCPPDFLANLVRPLEQQPSTGSVTALLLQPNGDRVDSFGLATDRTLSCFPRNRGERSPSPQDANLTLLGPAGAAAAFRREAWAAVGGLDEHLPGYMEDFELAIRLRCAGWGTASARNAVAIHVGSATFGHLSARQRWLGGFGRGYVLRRYRLLRKGVGVQVAATEIAVTVIDGVLHRDLAALRGRVSGWRIAGDLEPREFPPVSAIDQSISFIDSLRRRRASLNAADS